jgi:hypothetical protein
MIGKPVNIGDICRWLNVDDNTSLALWPVRANSIFNSKIRRFWISCIARDTVKHGAIGDSVFQNEPDSGNRVGVLGHCSPEGEWGV